MHMLAVDLKNILMVLADRPRSKRGKDLASCFSVQRGLKGEQSSGLQIQTAFILEIRNVKSFDWTQIKVEMADRRSTLHTCTVFQKADY